MTPNDTAGYQVLEYFTKNSNASAKACGSILLNKLSYIFSLNNSEIPWTNYLEH